MTKQKFEELNSKLNSKELREEINKKIDYTNPEAWDYIDELILCEIQKENNKKIKEMKNILDEIADDIKKKIKGKQLKIIIREVIKKWKTKI